ncbi:probable mitochondrial glutathione transporter SLC25A40 isoform X2 [Drosophila gunungcola]|uniref:probable mitochondrial glutathione transporter SLC25A40 isoform X2 n=1 Tax=Drosophila gunungcola TaxID=103775 RepID=UPI0022E61105|nr:probable mitochondrial glutathione transporter SLC25A40 isoform X2 [Drosophila gunungcola]
MAKREWESCAHLAAACAAVAATPSQSQSKATMTDPRFRIRPLQQVASACTGAMVTACFMTPLDVIKTRLQAQQQALLSKKCFLYCNGLMDHICPCGPDTPNPAVAKPAPRFSGTIDAFIKISRAEGVGSLWSGLSPTLISALPSTIIYFVAYEQFKARFTDLHYKYMQRPDSSANGRDIPLPIPFLVPLLAGVSARILAVTCVSPVELIRTKMQSQRMTHAEMFGTIRQVVQSQGILGLWRGLPPTILRDVPFSGIYWTCYEYLKSAFGVVEPTFSFSFAAGAISGSVAAMITTPFDVVKTHEQIEFGEKFIFSDNPQPPGKQVATKSVAVRLASIYRLGGVPAIFSGLGPRLFKVAPACAIMISSFEYGKSFFYHYNIDQHNRSIQASAS